MLGSGHWATRLCVAIALLGATFGLAACVDVVASPTPVFTADESAAAPKLKPGFWTNAICVDPRLMAESACRDGYIVSESTLNLTGIPPEAAGAAAAGADDFRPPYPYRIGVGDPLLMQLQLTEVAADERRTVYVLVALDPKSHDDQGRIDAAEVWFAKCGPPAEPRPDDNGPRPTEHPFPGVTMTDYGCTPPDRVGLAAVARASRSLPNAFRAVYRWMGERAPTPAPDPSR
jgi:hypothetical protein